MNSTQNEDAYYRELAELRLVAVDIGWGWRTVSDAAGGDSALAIPVLCVIP
jgi:hypothetical protein